MVRKLVLSLIAVLGVCALALAQNKQVTGTVSGQDGSPIAGATVLVDGTTVGTTTNADGTFTISAPANGTLSVSFIGYQSQQIPLAGKTRIEVTLREDTQAIDDVIVVAFGTAKKEAFTGSATVVKSEDIAKSQQSNVAQSLAGKVAGVQLTNTSGQPGSSPEIRIRGFSSLNADNKPLWIVDGMPFDGDLNNLNPADVESMTVLKDAASNALYGARGANGVVMITTKKARSQEAVVTLDAKWGVNSRAMQDYEFITDPAMFYETHYQALKNYYMSQGQSASAAHMRANQNLTKSAADGGLSYQVYTVPLGESFIGTNGKVNPRATLGTHMTYGGKEFWVQPDNWVDEAFRSSLRQEYNASVSGSNDKINYYASFGYLNNEGIVANSNMDRYTARLKADYQAKKWLRIGANASYSNFRYNQVDDSGSGQSSGNIFAYTSAIGPIYPLYVRGADKRIMRDENGLLMYDYGNGMNAGLQRTTFPNSNALSESQINKSLAEGNAFQGNGYFDVTFLKDFKFTFNASVAVDETRLTSTQNPWYGQFATEKGMVSKSHQRTTDFNIQQILNYHKTFGEKHNFDAMIGHEWYVNRLYYLSATKANQLTPNNDELAGAVTDKMGANSYRMEYNNEGYFGRVMYDYDNRIFLSGSYRRDASSRFHPSHRWGNFWSAGAAWIISREGFMEGASSWLDMLKLKASIGSQGNDNIGSYRYSDNYVITPSQGFATTVFNSRGSETITWETNTNFNAGFEFGFLQGAISGGIEYFYRKTTDMLMLFPAPPSIGYSSYYANVGDMVNKGIEIELNFTPIRSKNVQWDINLNMTHLRNKITMLPPERRTTVVDGYPGFASGTSFYGEGLPIYTFYMPKYAGVNDRGEALWYVNELDEKGNVVGRSTTNNYSSATNYTCGNPIPDLYGGFGTSVNFYGFDFGINFTYQIGGLAYDSGYASLMYSPSTSAVGTNWHKDIQKAWTPENARSNVPRLQFADQNMNGTSDRFLLDASYLNLQNINFGYTLPSKITRKFGVDKLRVYLACENVYYWSRRQGFDPRYSYNGATSAASYSPVRTISGGLSVTF